HDVAEIRKSGLDRKMVGTQCGHLPGHVEKIGAGLGEIKISRPYLMPTCRTRHQHHTQQGKQKYACHWPDPGWAGCPISTRNPLTSFRYWPCKAAGRFSANHLRSTSALTSSKRGVRAGSNAVTKTRW